MRRVILALLIIIFSSSFLVPHAVSNQVKSSDTVYPTVIIGGGVGALTSALYLSRAQILPVVIEGKQPGGTITQSHLVQNWPGEISISGYDLAQKIKKQAKANGALFLKQEVVSVDFSSFPFIITARDVTDENKLYQIKTYSTIIAMGTTPNFLNIPGEKNYWGNGVSNCATCDGSLYKDKVVAVVGGGDAAVLEAHYLSNMAKKVYVFVRKNRFSTQDVASFQELLKKNNVEVVYNTTVEKIEGNGKEVNNLLVQKKGENSLQRIDVDGVFLAIGSKPNTQLFEGKLNLGPQGHIVLMDGQKTNIDGVYSIGDISDYVNKQAITAAADGAKASMQVEKYLMKLQAKDEAITYLKPLSSSLELPKVVKNEESSSSIIEITSKEQLQKEINKSTLPIVVDFYADWCGPCKRIGKDLEKGSLELSGKVRFFKVNVDKVSALSEAYNIRSMPTVIVLSNKGKEINRRVGVDEIISLIKKLSSFKFNTSSDVSFQEILREKKKI